MSYAPGSQDVEPMEPWYWCRIGQYRCLAPLASLPTGAAGLDLIMYEKHMSLLFEGTRWVDIRRWGRLAQLPIDRAGQFVARVMPIPQAECDARAPNRPKGCEGNL
ncbi:MAG: hypothetical protein ABIP66_05865 [Gemmatimonadaceae bacterium]